MTNKLYLKYFKRDRSARFKDALDGLFSVFFYCPLTTNLSTGALMSRLWTGFFGTESCRTPKIFQNPDFTLKRRDFWVFFVGGIGASPAGERKQVV